MKLDTLDHPKTHDLCARLGERLPTVIGYLELLWHFTAKHAPQGDIGKWSNASIAKACAFDGDPDLFILEASKSGFIDGSVEYRLVVHDWHDHAPAWVAAKLKKLKSNFISKSHTKTNVYILEGSQSEQTSIQEPSTSLTKPYQAKGTTTAARAADRYADEFDSEIWPWYPKRSNNPKARALKAYTARRKEGHSAEEIQAGILRYAHYCEQTGKLNTEFVKQTATFLGPDKFFREAWEVPDAANQHDSPADRVRRANGL